MPHVGAKRTHFGVSFLFSFLSPVPADTPPFQAKALLLGLPTACPSFHSDLQCRNRVCPWAVLSAADARCGLPSPIRSSLAVPQSRSFPQAAVHRSNQSPSRLPLREQAGKPGNQKGTRCPADALFCFLGVSSHLGLIPGSGGFPECSAQHRTVRRRAAVKSAAEEAAHHRSKWRYPDQAGMPSVRWQWLCGAGH